MNCILAGVGGQGTVLASKLIAYTALAGNLHVRTAETIGMAQRGGCVVSHVRTGKIIHAPLIPLGQADLIIGFEPAEAVRCLPYLKKDGVVVVNKKAIRPVTASLADREYDGTEMLLYLKERVPGAIPVDGDSVCQTIGTAKVLNVVLLGAAIASGALAITKEQMERAIEATVKESFVAINKKALAAGFAAGKEESK